MRRASSHVISLLAACFFLILAVGSTKPKQKSDQDSRPPSVGESAEQAPDKAAQDIGEALRRTPSEKADEEDPRTAIGQITQKYGAIHARLSKLDLDQLAEQACDAETLLKSAQALGYENKYGVLKLVTVHGPFLQRFNSKDSSQWTEDKSGWQWVTSSIFRGGFETPLDERPAYQLPSLAKSIEKQFRKVRYLIVIWPDDRAQNRLPTVVKGTSTYHGGKFAGWMFIVDQEDASIACQTRLRVASGGDVSYRSRGLFRTTLEKKILTNFQDNFEKAIEQALPKGVEMESGYGSMFK